LWSDVEKIESGVLPGNNEKRNFSIEILKLTVELKKFISFWTMTHQIHRDHFSQTVFKKFL